MEIENKQEIDITGADPSAIVSQTELAEVGKSFNRPEVVAQEKPESNAHKALQIERQTVRDLKRQLSELAKEKESLMPYKQKWETQENRSRVKEIASKLQKGSGKLLRESEFFEAYDLLNGVPEETRIQKAFDLTCGSLADKMRMVSPAVTNAPQTPFQKDVVGDAFKKRFER